MIKPSRTAKRNADASIRRAPPDAVEWRRERALAVDFRFMGARKSDFFSFYFPFSTIGTPKKTIYLSTFGVCIKACAVGKANLDQKGRRR